MVEMIMYWGIPWVSKEYDLVCCAVLARQDHTLKIIQQAGLFCRLCLEAA